MRKKLMLPSNVSSKLNNLGNKLPWEKQPAEPAALSGKSDEKQQPLKNSYVSIGDIKHTS